MAMNSINGSSLHRSGLLENSQEKSPVKGEKKAAEANAAGSDWSSVGPAHGDKAEISDKAHQMAALREALDTGRAAVESLPDLRPEKVALARERLQSGFYQT